MVPASKNVVLIVEQRSCRQNALTHGVHNQKSEKLLQLSRCNCNKSVNVCFVRWLCVFSCCVTKQKQYNVMVLLLLTEPVTNIDIYLANVVFVYHVLQSIESVVRHSLHTNTRSVVGHIRPETVYSCRFSFTFVALLFCSKTIMSMRTKPDRTVTIYAVHSPLTVSLCCSLFAFGQIYIDCNLQRII